MEDSEQMKQLKPSFAKLLVAGHDLTLKHRAQPKQEPGSLSGQFQGAAKFQTSDLL